jgi:hypothetical protein
MNNFKAVRGSAWREVVAVEFKEEWVSLPDDQLPSRTSFQV